MSMANRNDPDVRQHETLPGLCPAPRHPLSLPSGARPVEQMVDAAIERIAMERDASERDAERGGIERVAHENQLAHYDYALEGGQPPSSQATRLRWKGLDVSEEFRDYAERIARGEDLPPFEGRVLAEPNAAFPWGSLSRGEPPAISSRAFTERPGRGGQLALWTSAAVVMALLSWSVALKVQAIDPPRALLDVAAKAADVPPPVDTLAAESSAPAVPVSGVPVSGASVSGASAGPVVEASAPHATEPPSAPLEAAALAQAAAPASEPVATPPAAVVAPPAPSAAPPAVASPAVTSPAGAAGVAVSIAPAAMEPLAAAQVPVLAAPAVSAPTAAPAPAPKPTASPRPDAELDFGIDELPLPSAPGASTKGQVSETGNIGDLARVGQSGGSAARKEPGSESSAKGSLLVDKPSF